MVALFKDVGAWLLIAMATIVIPAIIVGWLSLVIKASSYVLDVINVGGSI